MNALLLFAVIMVGYAFARVVKSSNPQVLRLVLTFSGAFLFAVAIFDLLPGLYEGEHSHTVGLWIMLGFLLQLGLELLSKGVEHGHRHIEGLAKGKAPWALLAGLYLHALLESMPIGAQPGSPTAISLTRAIALHSFPIAFVFYTLLKNLAISERGIFFYLFGFAIMAPLGIYLAGNLSFLVDSQKELTALTMGVFLHISTTILFESSKGHAFNIMKFGSILLAIGLAYFGHSHG
jgi:zinc transporter ZupT